MSDRPASRIAMFALLVAQLAYKGKGGPELAYRFEWIVRAAAEMDC